MFVSKVVMYLSADTNLALLYFPFTFQTSRALFSPRSRNSESLHCSVHAGSWCINKQQCWSRRSLSMQQVSFTTDLPAE